MLISANFKSSVRQVVLSRSGRLCIAEPEFSTTHATSSVDIQASSTPIARSRIFFFLNSWHIQKRISFYKISKRSLSYDNNVYKTSNQSYQLWLKCYIEHIDPIMHVQIEFHDVNITCARKNAKIVESWTA